MQAFQWPSVKSRVTVDGVIAVVDGAALAEGRVAADLDALAAQRAADASLDHDDPVEEVFEDQVACADLVVLSKSDLLDAAGAARANGIVGEHLARAVKIVPIEPTARSIRPSCSGSVLPSRTRSRTAGPTTTTSSTTSMTSSTASSSSCRPSRSGRARRAAFRPRPKQENVLRVKGFVEVGGKPMRLLRAGGRPARQPLLRPRLDRRARSAAAGWW